MTEFKTTEVPVSDVKAVEGKPNTLEAYVSVFDVVDHDDDVVKKGAFKKSIQEKVPTEQVKFVDGHNYTMKDTHGTVVDAKEDSRGLLVKIRFSTTQDSQQIKQKIEDGHIDGFSIGYKVHQAKPGKVDGKRVRILTELEIMEVSGLPVESNEETDVVSIKGVKKNVFSKLDLSEMNVNRKEVGQVVERVIESLDNTVSGEIGMGINVKQVDSDQLEEIMGIIGGTMETAIEQRMKNIRENLQQEGYDGSLLKEIMGVVGSVMESHTQSALDEMRKELASESNNEEEIEQDNTDKDEEKGMHNDEEDEKQDDEEEMEGKTFPTGFPFDDFQGCVAHFEDDPDVENPQLFCQDLQKAVEEDEVEESGDTAEEIDKEREKLAKDIEKKEKELEERIDFEPV